MNKIELIAAVAKRLDLAKVETERILDGILDEISETLVKGEKVAISGFGTFEIKERQERSGRNPRTGEDIFIPVQKRVSFKSGKALKDAVK